MSIQGSLLLQTKNLVNWLKKLYGVGKAWADICRRISLESMFVSTEIVGAHTGNKHSCSFPSYLGISLQALLIFVFIYRKSLSRHLSLQWPTVYVSACWKTDWNPVPWHKQGTNKQYRALPPVLVRLIKNWWPDERDKTLLQSHLQYHLLQSFTCRILLQYHPQCKCYSL